MRRRAMILALGAACSRGGDDDGASGGTESPTSTSAPMTGSGSTTDLSGPDDTSGPNDTTSDPDTGSTSIPTDDTTTGGFIEPVELVNDGWPKGGPVFFQQGFAMNECWASTYEPAPEHYPFDLIAVSMVVGGMDEGSANFEIAIWTVDDDGRPLEELASGTANISGDDAALDGVPLDIVGIVTDPFESGRFAISVCLIEHMGLPAISRDNDGLTYPDRNWIRLETGEWVASGDLMLMGDWIMRARIQPQGR